MPTDDPRAPTRCGCHAWLEEDQRVVLCELHSLAPELAKALRESERLLKAFADGKEPHGSILLAARQRNSALLSRAKETT